MALADIVEADLAVTLEGDGVEITLSPVGGTPKTAIGIYNTSSSDIDASTGEQIIVTKPSVSLRKSTISDFVTAGDWPNLPQKNWAVSVLIRGETLTWRISKVLPEDKLGVIPYQIIKV